MLKINKGSKDLSIILESYVSDSFIETLTTSESIDFGYYKPIQSLYLEIAPQALDNDVVIEFWNGSSWSQLTIVDRTFGLKKSGFISWERNIETQEESLLHGSTLYWYRLKVSTNDIPSLELKGMNLVFSDDNDLKESYPDIMEYLPENSPSFISYHQSARNFIISYLRNKGKSVQTKGVYKPLDQFDLHNYEEVKQASKYKALAMIFFNESDNVDDKWYQKAKDFDDLYAASIDLNFLSIDSNDDGKVTANEQQAIQFIQIQRL